MPRSICYPVFVNGERFWITEYANGEFHWAYSPIEDDSEFDTEFRSRRRNRDDDDDDLDRQRRLRRYY